MHKIQRISFPIAILLTLLSHVGLAEEVIYSGLTENGWQVFRYDFEKRKSTQLTESEGDKRTPVYSKIYGGYIYKGSKGRIWLINDRKEESVLVDIKGCGDFTLDGKDIYFTRLSTGNAQRQFVWKAIGEFPTSQKELIYRPEVGSIRQIQALDGKLIGTHIWRVGEEQIISIDLKKAENHIILTAGKEIATYPRWLDKHSLMFSKKQKEGNYDLYRIDLTKENAQHLIIGTKEVSEFASSYSPRSGLVYEQLSENGKWTIMYRPSQSEKSQILPIQTPAKEPVFIIR